MSFAASPYDPPMGPDHDVLIATFCEKLKPRVAVRGRIEKMPEPKLSLNWRFLFVFAANCAVWGGIANFLLHIGN